jgi:hypothetical protein
MTKRKQPRRARAPEPPPRTADEAVARARRHAFAALSETTQAVRALVDAASLATTGATSEAHASLAGATAWLDQLAERLESGAGRSGAAWLDAIARVLDDEIARWEQRGRVDPEARAVLRAFLGVREILWEFGLRASAPEPHDAADDDEGLHEREAPAPKPARRSDRDSAARASRSSRREPVRIQRVPVEG